MGTSATDIVSAIPFVRWTVEQAKKAATIAADALASLKTNRDFVNGDHWQSGNGWVGPWPTIVEAADAADADGVTTLQNEIKKAFTSRNAIGEVVGRHVAGVIGREPRWTFVPRDAVDDELSDAQETARDEIEALLTDWWDQSGAHAALQDAARKLLYSDNAGVALRIYVPSGLLALGPNGTRQLRVVTGDLADALKKIRVECPEPEVGRVVTDGTTGLDIGILLTKDGNGRESCELTFVDEGGKTVLMAVFAASTTGGPDRAEVRFDLGGRLLMMPIAREQFLSEQARQAQRALNYANTMIVRNVTTGGFLEQVLLNAKLPGHWEEMDGKRTYVADPIRRGPASITSFSGHEYEDAQGNKQITTPQVVWRDPVDPGHSIKAKREYYEDVLNETDQAHVLIAGDATASAVSRQQARADFRSSLQISEAPLNRAGRWLLETVLAYAEALALVPGKFSREWRASFACILDTGPLTPDEITAITGMAEKRVIAYGTAREQIGVADPDAEQERIETEDGVDLDREQKRAQIYAAWTGAGVAEGPAAERAGLSEEEIADLMVGFEEPPPPPAPASGGNNGNAGGNNPPPVPAGNNGNSGNSGGEQ